MRSHRASSVARSSAEKKAIRRGASRRAWIRIQAHFFAAARRILHFSFAVSVARVPRAGKNHVLSAVPLGSCVAVTHQQRPSSAGRDHTRTSLLKANRTVTSIGFDGFQVVPPRRPVVFIPALGHAGKVVVRNVEMDQIDLPAGSRRVKTEDQSRIRVLKSELTRTPRLDDEPRLDHGEHLSSEHAAKRLKLAPACRLIVTGAPVIAAWIAGSRYISKSRSAGAVSTTV